MRGVDLFMQTDKETEAPVFLLKELKPYDMRVHPCAVVGIMSKGCGHMAFLLENSRRLEVFQLLKR
jgi:hypothetical protein